MRTCEKDGLYRGYVVKHGVSKSKNGCVQFVAKLRLVQYENSAGAMEELPEAESIMAYLMLTKRDGRMNKAQINSIRDAFGWSGQSIVGLHKADLTQKEVEIVVTMGTDQDGNDRAEVSWINNPGGRGIKTVNDGELKGMQDIFDNARKQEAEAHDAATDAGMPLDSEIPF
jgi:hypothetical protein